MLAFHARMNVWERAACGDAMSFSTLFEPESVAMIGASRNETKVGYAVLKNVIDAGFSGRIYPVNRKADHVLGLKCYPTAGNIPDSVDQPSVHDMKKVERAAAMLESAVDFDRIYMALGLKH